MYLNVCELDSPVQDRVLPLFLVVKLDEPSRLPGWNRLLPYSWAAGKE